VTRKDDISKLVGKDGSNVKKLAKELEVPIRIVAESDDIKNFVTEVLFTVPIMGINILYTPEGIMYRVRVPLSHRTKLPISSEILASMSRSLFNVDIDIIFE
jgi:transcription antitermination factor NusA-like protein